MGSLFSSEAGLSPAVGSWRALFEEARQFEGRSAVFVVGRPTPIGRESMDAAILLDEDVEFGILRSADGDPSAFSAETTLEGGVAVLRASRRWKARMAFQPDEPRTIMVPVRNGELRSPIAGEMELFEGPEGLEVVVAGRRVAIVPDHHHHFSGWQVAAGEKVRAGDLLLKIRSGDEEGVVVAEADPRRPGSVKETCPWRDEIFDARDEALLAVVSASVRALRPECEIRGDEVPLPCAAVRDLDVFRQAAEIVLENPRRATRALLQVVMQTASEGIVVVAPKDGVYGGVADDGFGRFRAVLDGEPFGPPVHPEAAVNLADYGQAVSAGDPVCQVCPPLRIFSEAVATAEDAARKLAVLSAAPACREAAVLTVASSLLKTATLDPNSDLVVVPLALMPTGYEGPLAWDFRNSQDYRVGGFGYAFPGLTGVYARFPGMAWDLRAPRKKDKFEKMRGRRKAQTR